MFGLLDSASVTGAYAFRIDPSNTTTADVDVALFLRPGAPGGGVGLGFAPLTSMFLHGENSERRPDDYRPEVHDSDGLLIHTANGEWLWRALQNPTRLSRQVFAGRVRGFGLMQRDREFASYQDLTVTQHRASSIWNEPLSDWGDGCIHLIEMHSDRDDVDNITAYWVPAAALQPLQPHRFRYRQSWTLDGDAALATSRVIATRAGRDGRDPRRRVFVVDFRGPSLGETAPVPTAVASTSANGAVVSAQVVRNGPARAWRVLLEVAPKGAQDDQP